MPFKSKAQVRKFGALVNKGDLKKAVFNEWAKATPSIKALPEKKKQPVKKGK